MVGARTTRAALALAAALAVSLPIATAARADSGVIPDTPDLPWADPAHRSPLEVLSSQVASQIAGREVRILCNGTTDWELLRAQEGIPENVWGYVRGPQFYYVVARTFVDSSPDAQLAPVACQYLWNFGKATAKPTKCDASRLETISTLVTVRYKTLVTVMVLKKVKVKGKIVTRRVPVKKVVWRTRREERTSTRTVQLGRVPCYSTPAPGTTVGSPVGGMSEFHNFVFALATLAHESIHLLDFTAGRSIDIVATNQAAESHAECLGLQNIARVALALGDTPDDAAALGRYYVTEVYPRRRTENPDYWSADCVQNGPLDQTPGDGIWP